MNHLLDHAPGAATMAHPAMIRACRVAYRVAGLVGEPQLALAVRRAWARGDAAMVGSRLATLADCLAGIGAPPDLSRVLGRASVDLDALL